MYRYKLRQEMLNLIRDKKDDFRNKIRGISLQENDQSFFYLFLGKHFILPFIKISLSNDIDFT